MIDPAETSRIRYRDAKGGGASHATAIVASARNAGRDEIESARGLHEELSPAELHTLALNNRDDTVAITMLLANMVERQRRILRWVQLLVVLVAVVASRLFR